jgi:hypothetical protein
MPAILETCEAENERIPGPGQSRKKYLGAKRAESVVQGIWHLPLK